MLTQLEPPSSLHTRPSQHSAASSITYQRFPLPRLLLLTAAAVVVGASVILTDPIFQGLALSLIAGAVASTFLSWPTIPVLYFTLYARKQTGANQSGSQEGDSL